MSEVESSRTVTRTELLDMREQQWRGRLDLVSLAAEALDEIAVSHREQALSALGDLYRREYASAARGRVLRKWPSVHVLATTGVAADHYESGTFWPKLISLLGIYGDQAFHREWGEAFLANLSRLRLPTFEDDDDAGTKYVGRILMHSGMPTYCLRDFYRVVGERRSKVAGLQPDEFVSWAAARSAQRQLYNVDRPVARFLQYGGDYAVDVTSRAFDLLDAVAAGGDGSDVLLPERFKLVARQLHSEGGVIQIRQRYGRGGGDADQKPALVVDPFGQGLVLRLPAVGDAPDGSAIWLVGLDGATQRVATRALFPGLNEPAPQTAVPILEPIRSATAALLGREHLQATLTVVDEKDPLLAFGEDGQLLPAGLPLPGRPTWLLFPGDPDALHVVGDAPVVSESPLPPGWSGWCLVLLDLERASQVSLGDGGRMRGIRSQAAARVLAEEPLRGVRTSTGYPVVDAVPTVHLPEQLGEASWDVSLLDGSGDLVARWRSGGSESDPNSVWKSVPRPVVGTFTVRVRGPWGRGASRTLTVIEGLEVSFNPPWRRFVAGGGLQPCAAQLKAPDAGHASRTSIEFAENDRETYVRVGAHNDFRTLVVTPPHMTVAYQSAETTSGPSVKPLRLFREDISADPGFLVLDIGTSADPRLHFISGSGVVQTIDPGAGRAGTYRFGLSKLVDTLATYPQGQLALDDAGALVVAMVRPRRLFDEVSVVDGGLQFSNCVDVEGLTALVYATRAPWRDPIAVQITAGRAQLPSSHVDAGPLRVMVRIEDPWAPSPIPDWPEAGTSRLIESAGYPHDEEPEATAVSAFLAGQGDLSPQTSDLTRLWTVRGLVPGLSLGERIRDVAEAIDTAVHADPRSALLSITSSRAPTELIPSLLISAGLTWSNLVAAHHDKPPPWSVRSALPSTLLSAADSNWSEEEIEAASEVCGDVVTELLSGTDPFAGAGRLDVSADLFDSQPLMREEFVRQTGLVPTGLLSGDSRVLAAMEFVKQRRDPRIQWLTKNAHRVISEAERLIRIIDDPIAETAVNARRDLRVTGGWSVVPAISLAFSFASRHAARGNVVAAGWLPRQSRVWTDLALVVPQMVTIDLILAELLVASTAKNQEPNA